MGLPLTSGNYQLNYQGNLLSILPLPVTPGDLGQLAALSDLRELQKGRDPDTPGCGPHHHAGKPVPRKPVPARLRSGHGRQRS